jgi:primosomal protein N''
MVRKSVRPNIQIEKIYPKEIMEWKYETFSMGLSKDKATQLSRELIEAVEKSNGQTISLTLFLKRKRPVVTISWIEGADDGLEQE